MFAHHFYSGAGSAHLAQFVGRHARLAIVCDPPYGGMLAPLARSLDFLKAAHGGKHGDA